MWAWALCGVIAYFGLAVVVGKAFATGMGTDLQAPMPLTAAQRHVVAEDERRAVLERIEREFNERQRRQRAKPVAGLVTPEAL